MPILIIVSISDQLVHVYRGGIRMAASTRSTGKPGHRTPTGVFQILQTDMGKQLRRITADPHVREQIRKRMKNGMTVVTTDQSNSAAHRASDFTVLEGVC